MLQSLFSAILDDDPARAQKLLKSNSGLLSQAVSKSILATSISHWIYPGDTALHIAAMAHRPEITKLLLKAGADARSVSWYRNAQPLHYAADGYVSGKTFDPKRQVQTIRQLLEAGTDVQARDKNGATPLHRAVRTRCAAAVEFLLEAGADPNAKNKPGSTPFHLAVQNTGRGGSGTPEAKAAGRKIVYALMRSTANPLMKDANGRTVLHVARLRRHWLGQPMSKDILDARLRRVRREEAEKKLFGSRLHRLRENKLKAKSANDETQYRYFRDEWRRFNTRLCKGCQIWYFRTPEETWTIAFPLCGLEGFVIVRKGTFVDAFLTAIS